MTHSRRALALAATALVLPASAFAAATKDVAVKDNFFSKKSLTISKGTKVRWVWKGRAPHNVAVVSGPKKFHSRVQKKGTYTQTFKTKGTYKLVCQIHAPNMKMTVTVR